ncbi:hypothetical protein RRSWK_05933 [Rhodopirellula sp. SWK7]|nr:hypothetical protein RRSWK_05933 [Rhodopirellula sp. SWK7]
MLYSTADRPLRSVPDPDLRAAADGRGTLYGLTDWGARPGPPAPGDPNGIPPPADPGDGIDPAEGKLANGSFAGWLGGVAGTGAEGRAAPPVGTFSCVWQLLHRTTLPAADDGTFNVDWHPGHLNCNDPEEAELGPDGLGTFGVGITGRGAGPLVGDAAGAFVAGTFKTFWQLLHRTCLPRAESGICNVD